VGARASTAARDVFCNFPFDPEYQRLYIALVAGLLCTGQTPRTVLEIPPASDRLDRLLDLLSSCRYSLHDLSRVQLSPAPVRVPRFNMPFELGLAVALARRSPNRHQFRVLEAAPYRLQHSLSDLNGFDPYIHHGTVNGMFEAICDVFTDFRPFLVSDIRVFRRVYRALELFRSRRFRTASPYTSDRFKQLVVAGREYVREFAR
jgi:hypothetical protein